MSRYTPARATVKLRQKRGGENLPRFGLGQLQETKMEEFEKRKNMIGTDSIMTSNRSNI